MSMRRATTVFLLVAAFGFAGRATAQTGQADPVKPPTQTQTQATPTNEAAKDTRPATTTYLGDTGMWFVPTAEVVANTQVAVSGYRTGFNFQQGYTNVSYVAGTFAVSFKNRAEIFGSWNLDTRIDRDIRPLFTTDQNVGGQVNEYPFVHSGWTGNTLGDLSVGAKVNIASQWRQTPASFAVRGFLKVPTGDRDK